MKGVPPCISPRPSGPKTGGPAQPQAALAVPLKERHDSMAYRRPRLMACIIFVVFVSGIALAPLFAR